MSGSDPHWQYVQKAALRLEARGIRPFRLEELIREVHQTHPEIGRTSIQPLVQGMTVNAGKGPQGRGGKFFTRVGHGLYETLG